MARGSRVGPAALALCLALVAFPGAAPASDPAVPPDVRRAIESALKKKVEALLAEKDADGTSFRRGAWSRSLTKVDEMTYRVGFERDTAETASLLTERLLLTLRRSGGAFGITSEEVQDSVRALTRSVPGTETFHRFDALSFQREGLKVTAGHGSLYARTRDGRVEGFTLTATDLAYDYVPPLDQDRRLLEVHRRAHEEDLVFTPQFADVECDPVSCEEILQTAFTGLRDIALDETGDDVARDYREALEESRRARHEDPFADFSLPYDPGQRYYVVSLSRKKSDHAARLEYDDRQAREVSMEISGFGDWEYPSERTRNGGPTAEQVERRPDEEGRDYDLESLHGTIEMAVGDGELLTGDLTFGLKAVNDLKRVSFSIAQLHEEKSEKREARNPRMTINSVQDGTGRELTWVKTGAVSGLLILPETVAAGSRFTLRMQFENRDSIIKYSGTYSYVDREGWLPLVRYGDMIPDFDLTLKVPAKYETLCVGRRISEVKEGDVSVTRWVAESPVVFPTAIYGIYTEDDSGVKATKKDGQPIPVRAHFDKDTAGLIALKSLRAAADQAANALNLYREMFGVDYPYSKLDLVNAPEGLSGQSPASIVYLGNASFLSKGVLGTVGGGEVTRFADSLVAHEVAHQWWGALIAPANTRNYWWVESLAEYSAALYVEAAHGRPAYQAMVDDWRRHALENEAWDTVQDGEGIYDKGAYVFHMMRFTFGDETFFRFLRKLASDLRGREIVTHDIQRVAEEAAGAGPGGLDWFFDQWVRGAGIPELTFTWRVAAAEGGGQVIEGHIDQRVMVTTRAPAREPLSGVVFRMLGAVTLTGRSGREYTSRVALEGPSASFRMPLPEKPKSIVFNRRGEILAYDVIAKEEK